MENQEINYSYQVSSSINHLIHDKLEEMHKDSCDLLDKEDQNDVQALERLQVQSRDLFKLINIRLNL